MMRLHPGAGGINVVQRNLIELNITSGRTELRNELAVVPLWRLRCDIICQIFCQFLPRSMVSSLPGSNFVTNSLLV